MDKEKNEVIIDVDHLTKDYGYGTGWYSLDEFSGQTIENFTTISRA